jgi:hypothetical protein
MAITAGLVAVGGLVGVLGIRNVPQRDGGLAASAGAR